MADLSPVLGRTLVLVAHPDDETVGSGVLLQRMREPVVVFCTDGAPREESFWRQWGSRLQYARMRQEEAQTALSLAGVTEMAFLAELAGDAERFVDQELHRVIPDALIALNELVRRYRPEALLTLAYEGGHPDHDTCSFLGSVLAREHHLPCWEFPLYSRFQAGEIVYQSFLAPEADEMLLGIEPAELEVKHRMLTAYSSQHPFLLEFDPTVERFRPLHAYDYSQPPHPGPLNYQVWGWPVSGRELCAAFGKHRRTRLRVA